MVSLPAVPAFTGSDPLLPGQGNLAADVVAATGLGLAAGGLAYGAVTATGLGILALGAAPIAVGGVLAGGLVSVGAFALGLRQLQEWGLINWRPQPVTRGLEEGDVYRTGSTVNVGISVRFNTTVVRSNITSCDTGINFGSITNNQGDNNTPFFSGVAVRIGRITQNRTAICGSGPGFEGFSAPRFTVIKANGDEEVIQSTNTGEVIPNSNQSWSQVTTFRPVSFNVGGEIREADVTEPGTFAPNTRPRLFPPTLPDAPVLPPPPGSLPPVPLLPPPPTRDRPLAPPVPVQRPGQTPARPAGPGPTTTPRPSISPTRTPSRPAPRPITSGGVAPLQPGRPPTTATGTTFLPGGRPLVGNGPPATMQGIATELGKLEQKLEIVLNPSDPLSPLELLNKVIDQIENIEFLIDRLFPQGPYEFGPGAYQLAPVCDRDAEGNLIAPLTAEWSGGEGEFVELRQRLDALAELIQHHKTLKQPTCGGRGTGPSSNVTVHFESD